MPDFARKIAVWQRRHGRHGLPWQGTKDPYRIWVAEIMLQQTQVEAVVPYFRRFLLRFPDLQALARASQGQVLELWSGLGYYARARNLHAAAKRIAAEGEFPATVEELCRLPGIGRSTAGAIAAFAFGRRAAILDGNVKRVLARCFGARSEKRQWQLAERLLPGRGVPAYLQGLMDLGATLCTRLQPACGRCPVAKDCVALREGRVGELPVPRERKPLPLRRSTWFVLLHKGSVLLEHRPGSGIWGGLWAFPEMKPGGFEAKIVKKIPAVMHGFTHFRLRAEPLICQVRKLPPRAESPAYCWFKIAAAARSAVPAPVRELLLALLQDESAQQA